MHEDSVEDWSAFGSSAQRGKVGVAAREPSTVQDTARSGRLRLGTVDSWLVHQLTKGAVHVTDLSNASRTGLLNLDRLRGTGNCLTSSAFL